MAKEMIAQVVQDIHGVCSPENCEKEVEFYKVQESFELICSVWGDGPTDEECEWIEKANKVGGKRSVEAWFSLCC